MSRHKLVRIVSKHLPESSYREAVGTYERRKTGVYILYKGDLPYYVGKSERSIRGRIRKHRRDRHAGKWDNFSFYVVKKGYSDDVEALLLAYYTPKGNRTGRKFKVENSE